MTPPPVLSEVLTSPIVTFIESYLSTSRSSPLVVGISGPQGSGKTTLVNHLVSKLSGTYRVIAFSIDDIYLPHEELMELRRNHPYNKLLQYRGEPGTHDVQLGIQTLDNLLEGKSTPIPVYDKSKYGGLGDRVTPSKWLTTQQKVDLVLFEGWCVGFKALPPSVVAEKRFISTHPGTLKHHAIEHLQFVNEKLKCYHALWDKFDCLVWLNAQDINFVYEWRLQQEHIMKATLGQGMNDDEVKRFVDGYMPAYELYIPGLMRGEIFAEKDDKAILRIDYNSKREILAIQKGVIGNGIIWGDFS